MSERVEIDVTDYIERAVVVTDVSKKTGNNYSYLSLLVEGEEFRVFLQPAEIALLKLLAKKAD